MFYMASKKPERKKPAVKKNFVLPEIPPIMSSAEGKAFFEGQIGEGHKILNMRPSTPEQLKEMQELLDQWEKQNDSTIGDIDEKMHERYQESDKHIVGPEHFDEETLSEAAGRVRSQVTERTELFSKFVAELSKRR